MAQTKLLLIMPSVGRKPGTPYVKTWRMEPLGLAQVAALTPPFIQLSFCDDRLEEIPYQAPVDAVALSVETYTARRAYAIAGRFRRRGLPVILGGFHPTLVPEEAAARADCIVTGNAETVWPEVCDDLAARRLRPRYHGRCPHFTAVEPDRAVYRGRPYTRLRLVETGRGCPFSCEFCSVSAFFRRGYAGRPVGEVIREIQRLRSRLVFFIDDNIAVQRERTLELLRALVPLRLRWCGQVSLPVAEDTEMLALMKASGCVGVLIGFESLHPGNLDAMGKSLNRRRDDYGKAVAAFRRFNLGIYATFLFGYDHDTEETFAETLRFSRESRFFFTAFNHLVPFPGTPLHARLAAEGRLLHPAWWLAENYRFGDVVFRPRNFSPEELAARCLEYRRRFYRVSSIFRRGLDWRANCRSPLWFLIYWSQNLTARRDVEKRQGLVLGEGP